MLKLVLPELREHCRQCFRALGGQVLKRGSLSADIYWDILCQSVRIQLSCFVRGRLCETLNPISSLRSGIHRCGGRQLPGLLQLLRQARVREGGALVPHGCGEDRGGLRRREMHQCKCDLDVHPRCL